MAWRLRRNETRLCVQCGECFETRTPMKKTCSEECAREQKTLKERARRDARLVAVGRMATEWYNARRKEEERKAADSRRWKRSW